MISAASGCAVGHAATHKGRRRYLNLWSNRDRDRARDQLIAENFDLENLSSLTHFIVKYEINMIRALKREHAFQIFIVGISFSKRFFGSNSV